MAVVNKEEARSGMDDKISQYYECIRSIKEDRNRLSPIIVLPPELLSRIFGILSRDKLGSVLRPVEKEGRDAPEFRGLRWFRVTHVCRRWRNVALGCAPIWCEVFSFPNQFLQEVLKRSKSALLVTSLLNFPGEKDLSRKQAQRGLLALSLFERTRVFRLGSPVAFFEPFALRIPPKAPYLEALDLRQGSPVKQNATLPILKSGHAPLLKIARLANCAVPWETPLFDRLVSLNLFNVRGTSPNSSIAFAKALGRMTSLERLVLRNYGLSAGDGPMLPATPILLPKLTSLKIYGDLPNCINILAALTPPTYTRLTVRLFVLGNREPPVQLVQPLLRLMADHCRQAQLLLPMVRVALRCNNPSLNLLWYAIPSTCDPGSPFSKPLLDFSFATTGSTLPHVAAQVWDSFCVLLPMESITELYFHSPPSPEGAWLPPFLRSTKLYRLDLRFCCVRGLCKLTRSPSCPDFYDSWPDVPLLFRLLSDISTLGLYGVDALEGQVEEESIKVGEAIIWVCEQWRRRHYGSKELHIVGGLGITDELVTSWSATGVKVELDSKRSPPPLKSKGDESESEEEEFETLL
ncbi:hypothetical protein JAAARDRAFT_207835 [Jaapia argillacea MUCL 33604]|uniref:Uncharacterized protein n=1 Tax=Jaapia argillacea MUCL 33604 TaxID=933084 RepID=A0A067PPN3_9AGAM|nr:hypothetical protein JAAARDRAFT_207835 [Jaapia argillacea MUCL 33604]